MSLAVVRRASVLGLALVTLMSGYASADTLTADGDALLAGNQTSINLGEVTPGSTHGVDVGFMLACKNSTHVTAGATIAIVAADGGFSVPDDGSLVLTDGALTVPATWPATGTSCSGSEPAAVVTPAHLAIVAPSTAGPDRAFDVLFALADDEVVSNTIAITVTLDVVAPPDPPADDTDPVLHGMPADLVITTQGTHAVATWADPTATDDTDPSPSVACDPSSGSTFPLGATTVTCTATDNAGNEAHDTFTVLVVQEPAAPALVGTWQRPLADAVPALVGHAGRTIPLKLVVMAGSDTQGPDDIAAPTLGLESLSTCTANADGLETSAGQAFGWQNGSWQLNLDTSGLGSGCVRVMARVGSATVADAVIQLVPDTTAAKSRM